MGKKVDRWIGPARDKMESKGTVGKFGKATEKKIAAGKKAGGKQKKEAVFAENMKEIASHHRALARHHEGLAREHRKLADKHSY